eukprot:CAMPEP_0114496288 /NCGR_PEP_ID=MMETSP0109-20121206/5687_1 /TAXON_ID=29199 /ORGANISM="Chlorarachnion reptans, Strain CCCM449" /LENGTH=2039 /DNA_ID=CAMNT_0001673545 /DNA_START=135 /DNA_END=6254 /DNA_ORIENTATION=+
MMSSMPKRPTRLVEYFVTCGISQDSTPILKDDRQPITGIGVLTEKEECPEGWEPLTYTVSGNLASVNGTSMFTTKMYIVIERHPGNVPITDVQVIVGNEPKPMGYIQLPQNLNKGGLGKDVFLCYTHAYHLGHSREAVVDVVLIQPKSDERCPTDYMLVNKNLNAGSFRDPLYLCIKKISDSALEMRYKPVVLDRFPYYDLQDSAFPQMLPVFCYPQGADVVVGENPPLPKCTTFILTMVSGQKLYGVCLNFHELLKRETLETLKKDANEDENEGDTGGEDGAKTHIRKKTNPLLKSSQGRISSMSLGSDASQSEFDWLDPEMATSHLQRAMEAALEQDLQVWLPKTVCLVSFWPFYDTFTTFLVELWRLTLGSSPMPPERYLSNLWETPLPQNSRVNVSLKIAANNVTFDRPPPDTFPMADYNMELVFKCLSVPNIIKVLSALFAERKVLLVSAHSTLLTPVSEALLSFMFPFQWQYAYIPVLPTAVLGLDLLSAPMPVFVGITATHVDPKILAVGEVVFVNLDFDVVRIFGPQLVSIPSQLSKTLTAELKSEANVDVVPRFAQNQKSRDNIGSEFLFKHLPSADLSQNQMFRPRAARACFLHLTVTMLADTKYRTCLKFPHVSQSTIKREFGVDDVFDSDRFVSYFPKACQEFARTLASTQAFARLSDEKTLISSDRQQELDFFDHCCNYEGKYLKTVNSRRRRDAKNIPTLVQHLADSHQKSLVYEMPPPLSEDLEQRKYEYPEGFPFLDEKLFYSPRPVDGKYMRDVNTERRSHILSDFKSAFLKSQFKSMTALNDNANMNLETRLFLRDKNKLSKDDISRWIMYVYTAWFQLQVTRLTGPNVDSWSNFELLNGAVTRTLELFESLGGKMKFPEGKKAGTDVELLYRSLLVLCGEHNKTAKASIIFADMKAKGIETTGVTYTAYLNAMAARRSTQFSRQRSTILKGGTPRPKASMISGDTKSRSTLTAASKPITVGGKGDDGVTDSHPVARAVSDRQLRARKRLADTARTASTANLTNGPSAEQEETRRLASRTAKSRKRRGSMLPINFSTRMSMGGTRDIGKGIKSSLYRRDLDRKLRRRKQTIGAIGRSSTVSLLKSSMRAKGPVRSARSPPKDENGVSSNGSSGQTEDSKTGVDKSVSENMPVDVGSFEEGFQIMKIAEKKNHRLREKSPKPQIKVDYSDGRDETNGRGEGDALGRKASSDKGPKDIHQQIDWCKVEIGVGPGQIPGYGDGKDNEFDVSTPISQRNSQRLGLKIESVNQPDGTGSSMKSPKHLFERTKAEQTMVRGLCSLSTSEIMAGWPMDKDVYKSRSVRDPTLSFVPRVAVKYRTVPFKLKPKPQEINLPAKFSNSLPLPNRIMEESKINSGLAGLISATSSGRPGRTNPFNFTGDEYPRASRSSRSKSVGHGDDRPPRKAPRSPTPPPYSKDFFDKIKAKSARHLNVTQKFTPTPPRTPPPPSVLRAMAERKSRAALMRKQMEQHSQSQPTSQHPFEIGDTSASVPDIKKRVSRLSLLMEQKEREQTSKSSGSEAAPKSDEMVVLSSLRPEMDFEVCGTFQEHLVCVPFLSPMEIQQELSKAVKLCPEDFLEPTTFRETHMVLYWNIFWYTRALRLPFDFLLSESEMKCLKVLPLSNTEWVEKLVLPPNPRSSPPAPSTPAPLKPISPLPGDENKKFVIQEGVEEGGSDRNGARDVKATEAKMTSATEDSNTANEDMAKKVTGESKDSLALPEPMTPPSNANLKVQRLDDFINESGDTEPKKMEDGTTPTAFVDTPGPLPTKPGEPSITFQKGHKLKDSMSDLSDTMGAIHQPTEVGDTLTSPDFSKGPRLSNSAGIRRASMVRLRQKVLQSSEQEQKLAAERAETARWELGRIYLGIVQCLTRKKFASAMEGFLDGRMFVQSNLDFLYTALLSDQNELMLSVDWRGSMYVGLLQITRNNEDILRQYPTVQDFTSAFESVDQSFFRKDKRELITGEDQSPPHSVFDIFEKFQLENFFDTPSVLAEEPKSKAKSKPMKSVPEEPVGRRVLPSELYPNKS